jgi:hypothetical protein
VQRDALSLTRADLNGADLIITNPPFDRSRRLMHAMIDYLPTLAPCWLLLDAAWPFTTRSAGHRGDLQEIVAVGRVQWIPGSGTSGTDDYAWMRFDPRGTGPVSFHGRGEFDFIFG